MRLEEVKAYEKRLIEANERTPSEYSHWLTQAVSMANEQFGDLPIEKRQELAVSMAGHMAQMFSASKLDETLGLLHSACEDIAGER